MMTRSIGWLLLITFASGILGETIASAQTGIRIRLRQMSMTRYNQYLHDRRRYDDDYWHHLTDIYSPPYATIHQHPTLGRRASYPPSSVGPNYYDAYNVPNAPSVRPRLPAAARDQMIPNQPSRPATAAMRVEQEYLRRGPFEFDPNPRRPPRALERRAPRTYEPPEHPARADFAPQPVPEDIPRTFAEPGYDVSPDAFESPVPRTYADPPRTYADPPRTYADPPRTYADPPRTYADPEESDPFDSAPSGDFEALKEIDSEAPNRTPRRDRNVNGRQRVQLVDYRTEGRSPRNAEAGSTGPERPAFDGGESAQPVQQPNDYDSGYYPEEYGSQYGGDPPYGARYFDAPPPQPTFNGYDAPPGVGDPFGPGPGRPRPGQVRTPTNPRRGFGDATFDFLGEPPPTTFGERTRPLDRPSPRAFSQNDLPSDEAPYEHPTYHDYNLSPNMSAKRAAMYRYPSVGFGYFRPQIPQY